MKSLSEKQILKTYLESCLNYMDPLPYDTQYLLFVFLPANYMAKGCYSLDSILTKMKKKVAQLEHKLGYEQDELQRVQNKLQVLEKET